MLYPDPPGVDRSGPLPLAPFSGCAVPVRNALTPSTIGEVLRQGMGVMMKAWPALEAPDRGRNGGTRPLSSQCVRSLYDVIDLASGHGELDPQDLHESFWIFG